MQFIPHKGPKFYVQVNPQIHRSETSLIPEEFQSLWKQVISELVTEELQGKKWAKYVAIQQYAAAALKCRSKDADARAEKGEFERNYSPQAAAKNAQSKFNEKLVQLQKTDPLLHLAYVSTGEHGCKVFF